MEETLGLRSPQHGELAQKTKQVKESLNCCIQLKIVVRIVGLKRVKNKKLEKKNTTTTEKNSLQTSTSTYDASSSKITSFNQGNS
jgi:hypothetical protein